MLYTCTCQINYVRVPVPVRVRHHHRDCLMRNCKGYLWNSTQNNLPIYKLVCVLPPVGISIIDMSKADHRWVHEKVTWTKCSHHIYCLSLTVMDVWQSSINGNVSGLEAIGSPLSVCSQTKTAEDDDYPFFAIDFGKSFAVNHIAFSPTYPPYGKPFLLSPSIDYTYGPLARYVKLRVAHAPGMPGTFSMPPTSKDTAS